MKLAMISILLFCLIFAMAIPMKREGDKLEDLISQERSLEALISKLRHDLSMVEKEIDSLSSRSRIDSLVMPRGLGPNGIPIKIKELAK